MFTLGAAVVSRPLVGRPPRNQLCSQCFAFLRLRRREQRVAFGRNLGRQRRRRHSRLPAPSRQRQDPTPPKHCHERRGVRCGRRRAPNPTGCRGEKLASDSPQPSLRPGMEAELGSVGGVRGRLVAKPLPTQDLSRSISGRGKTDLQAVAGNLYTYLQCGVGAV